MRDNISSFSSLQYPLRDRGTLGICCSKTRAEHNIITSLPDRKEVLFPRIKVDAFMDQGLGLHIIVLLIFFLSGLVYSWDRGLALHVVLLIIVIAMFFSLVPFYGDK